MFTFLFGSHSNLMRQELLSFPSPLSIRKRRHREVKLPTQGHTASQCRDRIWVSDSKGHTHSPRPPAFLNPGVPSLSILLRSTHRTGLPSPVCRVCAPGGQGLTHSCPPLSPQSLAQQMSQKMGLVEHHLGFVWFCDEVLALNLVPASLSVSS